MDAIDDAIEAAGAALPGVEVDRSQLRREIEARLAGKDAPKLGAEMAAEVKLALACARGDAAAIAHFEARYLDVVAPALAHMKLPAATVEDVRAAVRDRLLVAEEGSSARILEYAGHGRLRGLVQVSAVRTAVSVVRKTRRESALDDDDRGGGVVREGGPELELVKEQYRAAFASAFADAARGLEARDRNLLRLHYLGGVTLEQLAAMYGVHRATVVRWLASARERVFSDTRKRMQGKVGEAELDEVMALIQSRLDVSVRRLLTSIQEDPPET